jgi:hypothetical protein
MGIGDPERNATDTYERGMKIVPENISANDGEIPVRQYNVAVLRNLLRFERAEGRMQVTNKRIIFRAPGRSLGGRTTLQQEFAIDEIAGIEAERGYRFSFFHIIMSLIFLNTPGFFLGSFLVDLASTTTSTGDGWWGAVYTTQHGAASFIIGILLSVSALALFFLVKRLFALKFLCLSIGHGGISALGGIGLAGFMGSGNMFFLIISLVYLLIVLFGLLLVVLRPDLKIIVKNKSALDQSAPVSIRRSRGFWMWRQQDTTGFSEVMPTPETERAIREIGAIISDIQKLGDMGVDKWKQ